MNDYIARFGLEFNPFLKNSRDIIIENEEFQEIQFRLNYLVETKGFGLLTSSPGLGKTTALRNFAASLTPARYKVIYSSLSTVTVMELYSSLVEAFGGVPAHRKADNFRVIQEAISRLAMNYNLEGLSKEEGRMYVSEKLRGAGCTQKIFDENALEAILNTANGTPRVINTLCNAALLIANTNSHNTVSAEDAMQAVNDCQLA